MGFCFQMITYFSKICRIDSFICSRKYKYNYNELSDDNELDKEEILFN
jgi:hypothetical protein